MTGVLNAGAVKMHPDDAAMFGISDGATVRLSTVTGSVELPAVIDDKERERCRQRAAV